MPSFRECISAKLSLYEDNGALLHETSVPLTVEYVPANTPAPWRAAYGPVYSSWHPHRLSAILAVLQEVLRED